MSVLFWLIAAAAVISVARYIRWLARWTGQHPPITPRRSDERQ